MHEPVSAFQIADLTINDTFMSHEATAEVLSDRWYGDMTSESSLWWVMLAIFVPVLLLWTPFHDEETGTAGSGERMSLRRRIKKFHRAPITRLELMNWRQYP